MMKLLLWITLTLLAAGPLAADVFSLFPFGNSGSGAPAADPAQALTPRDFWQEDLKMNGMPLHLTISLVDLPFRDAVRVLRNQYPDASATGNSNSFLMEVRRKNGTRKRLYLLELSGIYSVLQFSMELPAQVKKLTVSEWPADLPILPGARDLTVMEFPKRSAVFGSFRVGAGTEQTLSDMASRLAQSGWARMTSESINPMRGEGDIFMKEKPLAMVILGVLPGGKQKQESRATLYMRPIR